MKIIAKGDDYNVRLRIPTGLAFNRFTAAAISKEMGKYGVKIRPHQARILMNELKKYRRTQKCCSAVFFIHGVSSKKQNDEKSDETGKYRMRKTDQNQLKESYADRTQKE